MGNSKAVSRVPGVTASNCPFFGGTSETIASHSLANVEEILQGAHALLRFEPAKQAYVSSRTSLGTCAGCDARQYLRARRKPHCGLNVRK